MRLPICILLMSMLLVGCGVTTEIFRDKEGRVYKVESKGGPVRTIVEEEGVKIEHDSKKEPFTLEIPLTKIGK